MRATIVCLKIWTLLCISCLLMGCAGTNATSSSIVSSNEDSIEELGKYLGEYMQKGEYDSLIIKAVPHYESACKNGDRKLQAFTGAYIGQAYALSDNPRMMYKYFGEVAIYADSVHDDYLNMVVANGLGINARKTSLTYNTALAYFHEALQYAEKRGDEINYYIILSNIAQLYYYRQDSTGIKYARQVYEGGISTGSPYVKYLGSADLASMYYLQKDYDDALEYAKEANSIAQSMKSDVRESEILCGMVCASMNKTDDACSYFFTALKDTTNLKPSIYSEGLLQYGKFMSSQGNIAKADSLFRIGLTVAESNKEYHMRYAFYKELAKIREKRYFENKSKLLYDSLFNIDRERSFSNMVLKYETEKAENELSKNQLLLLEKNRKLQIAVLLCCIVAVILISLYILYMRNRQMYRKLVRQYEDYKQRERQLLALNKKNIEKDDAGVKGKSMELFEQMELMMNKNHLYRNKDLSMDKLCELLHSNRTYISKALADNGTSFAAYVNSYRMKEATAILSNPQEDIPLKALSDMLGYNSLSSFYRAFLKETGVPPSKFRQEMHEFFANSQD